MRSKRKRSWALTIHWLLKGGLFLVATFTTYDGVREIIIASSGKPDPVTQGLILLAITLLVLAILYTLSIMASRQAMWKRLAALPVYILLALISIGFSFGFYWKKLEAGALLTPDVISALTSVSDELNKASSKLNYAVKTMHDAAAYSAAKAKEENDVGGTCGDASPVGAGPRMELRRTDAARLSESEAKINRKLDEVNAHIKDFDLPGQIKKVTDTIHSGAESANRRHRTTQAAPPVDRNGAESAQGSQRCQIYHRQLYCAGTVGI